MKRYFVILLIMLQSQHVQCQNKQLELGDRLPAFSLRDQNDSLFDIQNYIGKDILVIYFYPKDESPVCTKESCSFRDRYADFVQAGARVIGINQGSVASHKKFQLHHQLPFTLLSDPDKKVLKLFGVKNKFVFTGRVTYVIGRTGKIEFIYNSFSKGPEHTAAALKFIQSMKE